MPELLPTATPQISKSIWRRSASRSKRMHLGPAFITSSGAVLQRSKDARIVNISSGMGAFSEMEGDYAAYRISKTALNAVTAILAAELRDRIAVNAACPGWVRSDMDGRRAEGDVAEGADTRVCVAVDAP